MSTQSKYYFHTAIVFLFVFGFGFLPPLAPITTEGMKVAGIFIGVIYGWSTVGMIWPSLLGLFALGFVDIMPMAQLISVAFGTDIFPFMLLMFTVMKLVESNGAGEYLANRILTINFLNGRPWLFSFAILAGTYIVSVMAGGPFVAAIIFWTICYSVFKKTGYKPYEKYPTLMIIGVMFSACLGLVAFPFKGNSIILVKTFTQLTGTDIDFVKYTCITIPLAILLIAAYILICRFLFRTDVSSLRSANELIAREDIVLTKTQKIALIILVSVVIIMMLPSLLPATFFLTKWLNMLGLSGRFAVITIAISIIHVDGKPVLDFRQMAANGIMWDAMFLSAFIMPISSLLTADATGIKPFLVKILSPILLGHASFTFVALVLILGSVLTNLANNGVICIILMSVVVSLSEQLGINPTALCVLLMLTVQMALVTPAASPFAAILFGNTSWVKAKDIYRYGTIMILLCTLIVIILGYFWSFVIF